MKRIASESGASIQTISRWIRETQETSEWFIEALAQQVIFEIVVAQVPLELAISAALQRCLLIIGADMYQSAAITMKAVTRNALAIVENTDFSKEKYQILLDRGNLALIRKLVGAEEFSQAPEGNFS